MKPIHEVLDDRLRKYVGTVMLDSEGHTLERIKADLQCTLRDAVLEHDLRVPKIEIVIFTPENDPSAVGWYVKPVDPFDPRWQTFAIQGMGNHLPPNRWPWGTP